MIETVTFCGINVSSIGLKYVPDVADAYVFAPAQHKEHEESFDAHNGGYYYGTSYKPKPFVLRFIFEEQDVRDGIYTKAENLFKIGKTGKLIFGNRNWIYYIATVVDIDLHQMTNYLNGYITVKMTAYYPYGRTDETHIDSASQNYRSMLNNSGMLSSECIPPTSIVDDENITEQREFFLYNGGTKEADCVVEIYGDVGDGITIMNATTRKAVKFVGLTDSTTKPTGADRICCDSLNGKTYWSNANGDVIQDAYLYHNQGFMKLVPSFDVKRNITAIKNGQYIYSEDDVFDETDIGKQIALNADGTIYVYTIINVLSPTQCSVDSGESIGDYTCEAAIGIYNKIVVTAATTMDISLLNFKYKYTFA